MNEISPKVYLHWGGSDWRNLFAKALKTMRRGDVSYSLARFICVCCEEYPGNVSVGVYDSHECVFVDRGEIQINIDTGEVRCDGELRPPVYVGPIPDFSLVEQVRKED